jgi:polysaccharide export outer membrane protein
MQHSFILLTILRRSRWRLYKLQLRRKCWWCTVPVGGNINFYFNGLKVDTNGDINVFGIGYVKAEGRTLDDVTKEIQAKVNENFQEGKSEVRLNTDGITYYILGDVETTGFQEKK